MLFYALLAFVLVGLLILFALLLDITTVFRNVRRRKLRGGIALMLGSAHLLAGCQTTADITSTVASFESEVQGDTQLACSFIPPVTTIAALIPGAGSAATTASAIAQSICAAIAAAPVPKTQSARLRSLKLGGQLGAPVVVGSMRGPGGKLVQITGQFTN